MQIRYIQSFFIQPFTETFTVQIDLRLLRQAQALAEYRSFTRAAEALNIAQPSLSRGIKELEARVGLPLFERLRSGHQPTDFGRVFLEHASGLLAGFEDLERDVAQTKGLGTLEMTVGFGAYAAEILAPSFAPRFVTEHPSVRLRLRMEDPTSMVRLLRSRSIDIAVCESSVMADDDAIEIIDTLEPVPGHVIVRAGHPLAAMNDAQIADILAYPYAQVVMLPARVLKPILAARRDSPMPTFPAIECPSFSLAASIVASTNAFTFASLGMVRSELDAGRIVSLMQADWMHAKWCIARLRKRVFSPPMLDMVETLRQAHREALDAETELRARWCR